MKKLIRSPKGFTLSELLIVMAIFLVVGLGVVLVGWGLAFAFSAKVVIPWLGVSAAWANAATLLSSIVLTGVFSIAVVVFCLMLILGVRRLFFSRSTVKHRGSNRLFSSRND